MYIFFDMVLDDACLLRNFDGIGEQREIRAACSKDEGKALEHAMNFHCASSETFCAPR